MHLFGGTRRHQRAALSLAGSTFGLGQVHVERLSKSTGAPLRDIARLLQDTIVPVFEPALPPDSRARKPVAEFTAMLNDDGSAGVDLGVTAAEASAWRDPFGWTEPYPAPRRRAGRDVGRARHDRAAVGAGGMAGRNFCTGWYDLGAPDAAGMRSAMRHRLAPLPSISGCAP